MNRTAGILGGLGGFDSRQDSPRRKKKKKNIVVFTVIILLLFVAYIVYAISQPEEIVVAGVAPSINGDSVVSPAMHGTAPEGKAAYATDKAQDESEQPVNRRSALSQNPVTVQLDWLDSYWKAAVRQVNTQKDPDIIQSQMALLDIAHADLFSLFEQLTNLTADENGWKDTDGGLSGRIEPDAALENGYIFSINEQNLTLMGRLDSNRNAFYYIVQDEQDKTTRFAEAVTNNGYCYVQLLTASGPYRGVLFFQFNQAGSVRVARIRSEDFSGLTQVFDDVPNDWDSFTAEAEQLFAIDANANASEDETGAGEAYAVG